MKNFKFFIQHTIGLTNKLVTDMISTEGLNGYGAYQILNGSLKHQENFRLPLSALSSIANEVKTSARYLLKIIKKYGLFVIDGDEFFSPELTDYMLRMKIKRYHNDKKSMQINTKKTKTGTEFKELNSVNKKVSNLRKILNDSKLKTFRVRANIYNYSQLKKRERDEEEKIAKRPAEKTKVSGAPRHFCQQEMEHHNMVNIPQMADSLQVNGPLPIVEALRRCSEIKTWTDWADEMERDDAYMELVAIHSGLRALFVANRKRIVELFKEHVKLYGKADGLITLSDVKYYFTNFMRSDTPTCKLLEKRLQDEEKARKAADPYRFESVSNGVREYPEGGVIPNDAPPRPSRYSVWSVPQRAWIG